MNDQRRGEPRRRGGAWRYFALVAGGALILILGLGMWAWSAKDDFFYPDPPVMPAIVEGDTARLLVRLEGVLQAKAPALAASFNPGLSDAEIDELEQQGGFTLTDEMRALYRWHDGTKTSAAGSFDGLVPIHRFVPLAEAVQERARAAKETTGLVAVVSGHRKYWLPVLSDGAGDGYYYDPGRADRPGHFFYNFAEDASYEYFPSLNNFIAGVIECYETDVYRPAQDSNLDADFERAQVIWSRYAAPNAR